MTERIAAADPSALARAAAVMSTGGMVCLPTETVYGLAVLPTDAALARLVEAKRRSSEKGIQLLIDSLEQVRAIARLSPVAELIADRYWPGPLTLVLARRPGVTLPAALGGGRPTLGLRLPDHPVPRGLARRLGPIAASSANVSGQPDATTAEQAMASLGDLIDLVIDDGPVRGGVPSTVVACLNDGPPEMLRAGAIAGSEIAALAATLGPR